MSTNQPSPEDLINEKMKSAERASIDRLLGRAKDELVEVTRQWASGDEEEKEVNARSERMSFLVGIIDWLENERTEV